MAKTLSFGVLHLGTSFTVTYALTGSIAVAGAVTFIEPLANTVLHYFFDKYWDDPRAQAWRARLGRPAQHATQHATQQAAQPAG